PTTEAEATPEVTQAPEGTATAEPEETAATVVATAKVTVEPEETAEATAEPEETATAEPTAEGTPEPTPTPWPTPTPMTLEGYQSLRADYLAYVHEQTGFDEQAFLNLMESYVLRDKLQEALAAEVPTTAPQVNVRQILLGSQEEADEVLGRLRDGEDFADLARELSQDATKENGGDVGWLPATSTALPTTVVGRAFELEPGERAVVASYLGYHLIEVVEKADDRPLSEMDLEAVRSDALRTWLDTAAADEGVQRMLSEDKLPAGYR
ncbi:MAG: peptidylprolyl isomerase, partial [Anaerolineae bacterium]